MALSSDQRLEILAEIQDRLIKISALHEAAWILDFATKLDSHGARERCLEIVERRENHEPLAYIFGSWSFRRYEFFVGPGVLIPRPETEELVEAALMSLENSLSTSALALDKNLVIADLGAGSGCIGISLVCDLLRDVDTETGNALRISQKYKLILVERSPRALEYLEKNVAFHRKELMNTKVEIFKGSWEEWPMTPCDLILSNPPYLTEHEFSEIESSVKDYEPKSALVPFDIKTEVLAHGPYKAILEIAKNSLNSGGWLWFELGQTQPAWIQEFTKEFEVFNDLRMMRDMSRKYRFFCARKS